MADTRVLRLLGLAMRAGKLALGEGRAEDSIRLKKGKLLILAADASDNTRKKFQDKCVYYHTPLLTVADRYELGACLGREFAVVAAVEDVGFAKRLSELCAESNDEREQEVME